MAGLLLLLMIFMLLGSLVYTPGVLVELGQTITITRANQIVFDGKTNAAADLDRLRADLRAWPGDGPFSVKMEPGADPRIAQQVSNLFQITLPDGQNLIGTDNESVVVAVNFRGQCFLENRPVNDAELTEALRHRLRTAARHARKLTLVLYMDKAAENNVLTHLESLARQAGVTEVLRAQRPAVLRVSP
jgi:biopolymer transport protein ExbD